MDKKPLYAMLTEISASMLQLIPQATAKELAEICALEGTNDEKAAMQDAILTAAVVAGAIAGVIASRDYIRVMQYRGEEITRQDLEQVIRMLSPANGEPMVLLSPITDEDIDGKLEEFEQVYKRAN